MRKKDAQALVNKATSAVRKRWGKSVPAEVASEDLVDYSVWLSTGSLALDRAITGTLPGGIPIGPKRGTTAHIFGDPSLGKSLLADHLIKSVQELGGIALISETEGSRTPHFAKSIAVDLKRFAVLRPATVGGVFDTGLEWVANVRADDEEIPILWLLDSLELVEAEKTAGKSLSKETEAYQFGGGRAKEINEGLRKVAAESNRHPTTFVILNQVRENIGVMFGAKKKPTGGYGPRFLASVEVQLTSSRFGVIKNEREDIVGRWVHAHVVKNKTGGPYGKRCDFLIRFDRGVQRWPGVLEMLVAEKAIEVKGGEFVNRETGEVLPLNEFVAWCERTNVLGAAPQKEG